MGGPRRVETGALQLSHRVDSLPGSVARSARRTSWASMPAGPSTFPRTWGLGLRNDVRTRLAHQQTKHDVRVDPAVRSASRLQDNGRRRSISRPTRTCRDNIVSHFKGSHIVTFDNNLNRRFAQHATFSVVLQFQFYGPASRPLRRWPGPD